MHPGESLEQQIGSFLANKKKFQLGELLTEQGHSLTAELSRLASEDVLEGLRTLIQVDIEALIKCRDLYLEQMEYMCVKITQCLKRGGRIFLGGCGATGRLSICLERLWRETHINKLDLQDSVISFMAGGDVAFVHAIEGFEDYPEYGARQLEELGFSSKDLFIGITEGGETPFVIGATKRASEIASENALFLFSNPENLLKQKVKRSKEIVEDPKVTPLDFHTGPMALAGSTRMQSSTVLMMSAGLSLFSVGRSEPKKWMREFIDDLIDSLQNRLPLKSLAEFCRWEASVYKDQESTIYNCDEYSVTVFTDTTERAPTFSLASFDNQLIPQSQSSLTYVCIPSADTADEAWHKLFYRSPRTLDWSEDFKKARIDYLRGFDFSIAAQDFRRKLLLPRQKPKDISVRDSGSALNLEFQDSLIEIDVSKFHILQRHLLLKMLLNAHSTLLMGRLGRYESHFMTYVSPSNGKLVDRATRYVLQLAAQRGTELAYDEVAECVFRTQKEIKVGEPVVLAVLNRLEGRL